MEREITHSCGHQQRHQISGFFAADSDREAARVARRKCSACYEAGKQTKAAQADAALADLALLPLTGSEKQVAWATSIRAERLAALRRKDPSAVASFAGIAEAKWWIDHRGDDLMATIQRIELRA